MGVPYIPVIGLVGTDLLKRRDDLNERGVRVRFIGRRGGRVPKRVLRHIEDTESLTHNNRRMTLTFAFNYGGRAELVDAIKDIAAEARAKKLDPNKIDEKTIRAQRCLRQTRKPTRSSGVLGKPRAYRTISQ